MTRPLYRSRTDTVLGGVAAGLAKYLNADPALVRIAWAILVPVTSGAAFLAYIVAWIVVPEQPIAADASTVTGDEGDSDHALPSAAATPGARRDQGDGGRGGLIVGIGLVLIGVWFLVRDYLPSINWTLLWPAILIGIGALILISSARRRA